MIGRFLFLIYLYKKLEWKKLFKLYSSESDIILWIPTSNFIEFVKYFLGTSNNLHDCAILNYFTKNNLNFRIIIGLRTIGNLSGKNIYYTPTKLINYASLYNYTALMHTVLLELKNQGNKLFPPYEEILWWENKAFMHQKFDELSINEPKTDLIDVFDFISNLNTRAEGLTFPFLIKELHSASAMGVYKVASSNELVELLNNFIKRGVYQVLFQELINMRKDLRVILLDNEIILHYWRINNKTEWMPTSTGYGSDVDFHNFPESWRQVIIDAFKKTGLTTGGFDITWQNDDLSTAPIFLEISPLYQPNPSPSKNYINKPYHLFKKSLFGEDPYYKKYIDLVFHIKINIFNHYKN